MNIFDKMFEGESTPISTNNTNNTTNNNDNSNIYNNNDNNNQLLSTSMMTPFPKQTPLAMAYVPFQMWEMPYDDAVGFVRGTIFPSLDKPFIGEEAVKDARKR